MSSKVPRNWMVELGVSRPITTTMAFLALLVLGWIAYRRIPVQQLPSGYTPPFMMVIVPYPGANPREVELQITTPIEEALRTVEGVEEIHSRSGPDRSLVFIEFTGAADMDVAYAQVTDRIERVRARLPADVDSIFVRKYNLDDMAIFYLAVSPRRGKGDPELFLVQKSHLIEEAVVNRLERLPGVARVESSGLFQEQIEIALNRERVLQHRVNLYELFGRLSRENFNLSAGRITAGGTHYYLRSIARIDDPAKIAELPVRDGLILGDLLDEKPRLAYSVPDRLSRIDLSATATVEIYQVGDANTVETCAGIRRAIEEELSADPRLADFEFTLLYSQGDSIKESLDGLESSALWGAFLAMGVLYLFLRRVGTTLVITLSIPLSLLLALATLYFQGESLNLLSLMGLTLGVGMLVDNSIVVVENIDRLRAARGLDPRTSARVGASEIALAVVLSTATSMIVFLPLVLMGEDRAFRFFMARLGAPVCYSLGASLFVALVFIPFAASRVRPRVPFARFWRFVLFPAAFVQRQIDRALGAVIAFGTRLYGFLLGLCLAHRFDAVFWLLVPAMASTWWVYGKIDQTDRGSDLSREFHVTLILPDDFTIWEADDATKIVEERIWANRERLEVVNLFTTVNTRRAEIRATLTPREEMRREKDEIVADVEKLLPKLPGVDARMGWHWQRGQASDSGVTLELEGPDSERLSDIAREFEHHLQGLPGLTGLESDVERGFDEIRIIVDRPAAQRYRLDPRAIVGTVQYAVRGQRLPDLLTGDREIPVVIRTKIESDFDLERLKSLPIWTRDGREIPLAAVARFEQGKGFGQISHEGGRTVLTLTAEGEGEDLRNLSAAIDARLAGVELPEGYEWKKGGSFDEWKANQESFLFAVGLAILFVFLLMGVLFESFLLPLAVVIAIPFAFTGVYWILYLTDTPMGIMTFIGLVILVGVVINNGIVLVDLINRLRASGVDRARAMVEGSRDRLRPVLMTAGTTIVGLLPMALGDTAVADVPYYPLGRALIGGLAASTIFTLFLVPVFYSLLDDLGSSFSRAAARLLPLGRRKTEKPGTASRSAPADP
ncbi:MAG: efflux RND transporter permease subunit [Planctomycetes bacterium]|nr:efflux RND transporter permease subunit [Planctomycetota bacterium]